jgi:hypothetical protein
MWWYIQKTARNRLWASVFMYLDRFAVICICDVKCRQWIDLRHIFQHDGRHRTHSKTAKQLGTRRQVSLVSPGVNRSLSSNVFIFCYLKILKNQYWTSKTLVWCIYRIVMPDKTQHNHNPKCPICVFHISMSQLDATAGQPTTEDGNIPDDSHLHTHRRENRNLSLPLRRLLKTG